MGQYWRDCILAELRQILPTNRNLWRNKTDNSGRLLTVMPGWNDLHCVCLWLLQLLPDLSTRMSIRVRHQFYRSRLLCERLWRMPSHISGHLRSPLIAQSSLHCGFLLMQSVSERNLFCGHAYRICLRALSEPSTAASASLPRIFLPTVFLSRSLRPWFL